jgi:NitT/TauT family transport system substrate-binding protein
MTSSRSAANFAVLKPTRTGIRIGAACAVLALLASGCGGQTGGSTKVAANSAGLTELNVGVIPINAVAPVYLGIEKGFFKNEGLKITPQSSAGGAEIIPLVVSGKVQIGFSNGVSLLTAYSKGLDLRAIAPGETSPSSADEDNTALMVPADSPIKNSNDLEGKVIGVNTLNNIATLTVTAALAKQGVDATKLKFVEIPFPSMLGTLQGKKIDAGFFNEPFRTQALESGLRTIIRPYSGAAPDLPIGPYFTSAAFLAKNRSVVEQFVRALNKSTQYAKDHPDELRKTVLTYTKTPENVVAKMSLPHYSDKLSVDGLRRLADLMVRYHYVENMPPLEPFVFTPTG